MNEALEGKLGFLLSNIGSGAAQVAFLAVVRSRSPAFPEVEIRRVIVDASGPGTELEPLDAKRGSVRIEELNENGGQIESKVGVATLRLSGTAARHVDAFVWEISVRVHPGSIVPKDKRLDLVLLGRFQSSDPFLELARVPVSGISPNQLNTQDPRVVLLRANPVPRLSVGINEAAPPPAPATYDIRQPALQPGSGQAENAASGAAADVAAALYRVFVLLDAPNTLDPVWDAQTTDRSIFNLSSRLLERDPVRAAEELWARQVTEMLLFTPYGGPSGTTGISPESRFISEGLADADPRYGITFACQQLASFGLAARGVKFTRLNRGGELMVNAGSTTARTFTSSPVGGKWFVFNGDTPREVSSPNGSASQLQSSLPTSGQPFFDAGISPGSVFLFANRAPRDDGDAFSRGSGCTVVTLADGPVEFCVKTDKAGKATSTASKIRGGLLVDNTANAHAAFVLRTDPRRKVFQTFDTGGLSVPARGNDVSVFPAGTGFHSGNFDDPAGTKIGGGDPFRGMGVLPPLDVSGANQLLARVNDVLKKARPLGFARCVLIRRGAQPSNREFKSGNAHKLITDGRLVFASPLLRMHGDAADQNYAISRYLWSLRDFPARETLEAWWFIYIPQSELARAALASARGDSIGTIAERAFRSVMSAKRQLNFSLDKQGRTPDTEKIVRALVSPVLNCTATRTGRVEITATVRSPQSLHALHVLEAQASATIRPNLPRLEMFPAAGPSDVPSYFTG